jgi:hypothetical protein
VLASDAFFPFRDGLDEAAKAGVTAVIQPGGSLKDEEVIRAANEHGISMVMTGMRHFRLRGDQIFSKRKKFLRGAGFRKTINKTRQSFG